MKPVIKEILKQLKEVHSESYYLMNSKKTVVYPYLVFSTSLTNIDRNADGCYLDIDIFDNKGFNQSDIETMAQEIKRHFEHLDIMLEDCYMRMQFQGLQNVPTNSDTLQRRNLRFYLKIDWRN